LPLLLSPVVATDAVFDTLVTPGATATTSCNVVAPPGASGPALVQVTTCPLAWQLHPAPLPLTKVSPDCRTS
jgi:hypothetical protein